MVGPQRFVALGALYVTQGIVYGFAAYQLLPRLAGAGASLAEQGGILGLAGLPWIFKLAWGPLLDRAASSARGGPQRIAQLAMLIVAACVGGIAFVGQPAEAVLTLAVLWLLLNIALSLQDVATDALALDVIREEERGVANGVMLGSHHLGLEGIGGIALGFIIGASSLETGLWILAAIVAALSAAPGMVTTNVAPRLRSRTDLRAALDVLRRSGAWPVLLVAALAFGGDVLTSAAAGEFLVKHLQWPLDKVATELPLVLLPANIVGYVVAAAAVDAIGHRRAATYGAAGLGALWIAFSLIPGAWSSDAFMYAFVSAQALITALFYVGMHALLMDAVDLRIRATHFAVLMAVLNLPRAFAPPLAAPIVAAWSFTGLFAIAGAYQLLVAVALGFLRPSASAQD